MMIEGTAYGGAEVRRCAGGWHLTLAAALLAVVSGCHLVRPLPTGPLPELTHGVAVGEVEPTRAVLWGRCAPAGRLHVRLGDPPRTHAAAVEPARDFTARLRLDDLTPDTTYAYRVWCSDGRNDDGAVGLDGRFRTAPDPDGTRPLRIAWSGDLGGQNVCRDATRGYPIFAILAARAPDLFIALGDMIYGDDTCTATGRYGNAQLPGPPPARDRAGYWAHWRYNRADPHQQALLARVPMAAVWDDHEIVDDAGPLHDVAPDAPDTALLAPARAAFFDYQPLLPPADDPTRVYRRQRWGRHLELFILDTRQYRDANSAPDSEGAPKSLLGPVQRRWLEEALVASTATWKVIVSSVPLSIPTGSGPARDGFASGDGSGGFEREAAELFAVLHARGVRNHLWLSTDVHFATALRYRPIATDPQWTSHEFITGPLNAGVFPRTDLDPTFRPERLLFYGPPAPAAIASFDDAVGWFNFGVIEILGGGRLSISVVNGNGQTVYRTTLRPS